LSHQTAAVIVVYRPAREPLLQLLRAIGGEAARIYLFLNSGIERTLLADCIAAAAPTPVETLGVGANVGLGRAYNEAAAAASAAGCDLLLLFDQDSAPLAGIVRRLAAAFDTASERFGRVAAIGPRPVPPDELGTIAPAACASPLHFADVPFLISSGSLIALDALQTIGPFREDFFIDAIDIEWCFRAHACGFHCVMTRGEPMTHPLGIGVLALPLFNLRLTRQPQARLFTFARNQTAMLRLPHVPLWWKARIAALLSLRLILSALSRQWAEARAIVRGVRAGLRRELGPPA
jgi:rhamnosyltransferase